MAAPGTFYLGIEIKSGYGFWQFLSLPMISTAIVCVVAYVQAQLAYMLEDKDMFNAPSNKIGQIVSDFTVYSIPFTMVFTCITSYIFELLGRRWTIFLSFFLTSLAMIGLPYTSPDMGWLMVVRIVIGVTMTAPMAHPLVPDYVKRNSRGKAIALMGVGVVIGELFAMGVLFNLTKSMNYYDAFLVAGLIITFFAFFFLCAIRDPNLKNIRGK